ncbi:hypothetical protein WICPIJ_003086 [Wickerhamomyces pijperi]|uniref:Uncharacterized protein n=1 Tax=Wickerhamomyces pijperi TaxID=599730 RepID=A0A9P8QAD1_WICPI|nr:hypothetical protein WICPIJ_003086 [Wickerhamomyces pijperi]
MTKRPLLSTSKSTASAFKPPMYGLLPMATNKTSDSKVSLAPESTFSTSILTVSPCLSPEITLVPNLNLKPCFCRNFWVALATSPSMEAPMAFWNSTMVTSEPNLE